LWWGESDGYCFYYLEIFSLIQFLLTLKWKSRPVFHADIYDGSPPQCLIEARRGKVFLQKPQKMNFHRFTDPPRGRPVGGGDTYHNWGYGGISPHHLSHNKF
jgi:hypothetical protein